MQRYNPKDIESKWQKIWEEQGLYHASENPDKPKKYVLEYFPYPSGAAMHVGHVRNYTIGDVVSRFYRMQGYNVLHPMGWDSFGLPAENYAIKTGTSPRKAIDDNTAHFKEQLMQMGFGYDWSREIDSSRPDYYRWTQEFFLLLYKRGLAYQQESLQWWCPVDKTVLANEQVENGKCWRCGNDVEKKSLKQWFFKITDYADRLLQDLDELNWSESIKSMQRNWIGKSSGAEIDFKIYDNNEKLTVFTTRPDTLYGATFMVVAPEHPIVGKITADEHRDAVQAYIKETQAKNDIQRQETEREKTGVFTGAYAINPVNDEKIPVWIADYVLYGYGTGAIMAVPAHDERDWDFAKKFDLRIVRVIKNDDSDDKCTSGEGILMNSGDSSGISSADAREKIVDLLEQKRVGKGVINYKIRDWLISRQRYWGAPIPILHCPKDGVVAVPNDQLPVKLPEIESYEPSGDGRSPLARVNEFMHTTCPKCGGPAERETDTMDGFACSSWYFLRFADPHNDKEAFSPHQAKFWLPVDDYIGGAEHAVMHLLYARFWTKVMFDEGLIEFSEPFTTLRNQGMILAPDGQKMSKSKGNTIEPGGLIDQGYGADAIRLMELFIGPWDQAASWSVEGLGGTYRFLNRMWTLIGQAQNVSGGQSHDAELLKITHKTIKKVTEDLQTMSFNTAIAAMMEAVNDLYKLKSKDFYGSKDWQWAIESLLQLLAPFAPHITEEIWNQLGHKESIHISQWPKWDEKYLAEDTITIAVQINGKVRAELKLAPDVTDADAIAAATSDPKVRDYLTGKDIKKSIYIKGRLVSLVI